MRVFPPKSTVNFTGRGPAIIRAKSSGPIVSSVAWDATNKNANAVLSGGNRTATTNGSGGFNFAGRAVAGGAIAAAAKLYWEEAITGTGGSPGVANGSNTFGDNAFLGGDANGLGYYPTGVFFNNASVATLASYAQGDVVGCACIGGGKVWFRVNGGGWNNDILANQNPATNTGGIDVSTMGILYPAYNVQGAAGAVTGNFGSTFSFAAPSGFTGFP